MMHTLRVLLVEDNPGDAALIRIALGEASAGTAVRPWFDVRPVTRLALALEALEALAREATGEEDAVVVLLDLHLPDTQGLDGLARLHAAAPDTPIVLLTGLDDDAVALEAMRAGAQDYLLKGRADGDTISRAIRYALARKRTERELARAQWLAGIGETALAVRHEVATPLHWLVANAELLPAADANDRTAIVDDMVAGARRIAAVLKQLESLGAPQAVAAGGGQRMLKLSAERKG